MISERNETVKTSETNKTQNVKPRCFSLLGVDLSQSLVAVNVQCTTLETHGRDPSVTTSTKPLPLTREQRWSRTFWVRTNDSPGRFLR